MPTPERRELSVESADGTPLHVEVHGPEDGPTVVLSHGWTCSIPFWAPVVRQLDPEVRVVLYDQRGHGRSATPPRSTYGVGALADDLCAVLEATVPEGTSVVLGGHSMGSMTLVAAADRPQVQQRAAAAVLTSTGTAELPRRSRILPGRDRFPRLVTLGHRLLLGAPVPWGPASPLSRPLVHYITMGPDPDPQMLRFCTRLVHACPTLPRARWGRVLGTLNLDRSAREFRVPSVVVAGTADRLTPMDRAHHLAELLPDCRELVEIPGAGHMTPLEDPTRVATVISDLIATHLRSPHPAPDTDPTPERSGA